MFLKLETLKTGASSKFSSNVKITRSKYIHTKFTICLVNFMDSKFWYTLYFTLNDATVDVKRPGWKLCDLHCLARFLKIFWKNKRNTYHKCLAKTSALKAFFKGKNKNNRILVYCFMPNKTMVGLKFVSYLFKYTNSLDFT